MRSNNCRKKEDEEALDLQGGRQHCATGGMTEAAAEKERRVCGVQACVRERGGVEKHLFQRICHLSLGSITK